MHPIQQESGARVVALAGRRTDAVGTDTLRFPLTNIDDVRGKLRSLFLKEKTSILICSAACGADLVALDAAAELNIERHVILPFSIPEFRRISVTDRPGEWGKLYDQIICDVSEKGYLHLLGFDSDDDLAFSKANKAIISQAKSLASNTTPLAVVVWEGESQGPIDATREFLELAKRANFDDASIKSV